MRITLLCATRRGQRMLEALLELAPDAVSDVASFRESPGEPKFFESIRSIALGAGATFHEAHSGFGLAALGSGRQPPLDLLIAVNWRFLVPASVYLQARRGAFVFHDSLLPAYRGFSPTVWAVANGETQTGVTLFRMAEKVDSGEIIAQEPVPIHGDETIAQVVERVTETYLSILTQYLPDLVSGTAHGVPQDESAATYVPKRTALDNVIHWMKPTDVIYDLIRAVTAPYPGATTIIEGRRLTIWAAERLATPADFAGAPGEVVEVWPTRGSVVSTATGSLLITQAAFDGGIPRSADLILNRVGQQLGG